MRNRCVVAVRSCDDDEIDVVDDTPQCVDVRIDRDAFIGRTGLLDTLGVAGHHRGNREAGSGSDQGRVEDRSGQPIADDGRSELFGRPLVAGRCWVARHGCWLVMGAIVPELNRSADGDPRYADAALRRRAVARLLLLEVEMTDAPAR